MRDYAIQTWGAWLDKESKQAAIEDTAKGKIQIICIGEEQAGTLEVEEVGSVLVNPAQQFYKRNGFTVHSETAERVYMRYTP